MVRVRNIVNKLVYFAWAIKDQRVEFERKSEEGIFVKLLILKEKMVGLEGLEPSTKGL